MRTICDRFGLRPTAGTWGIEVEVEGRNLPTRFPKNEWRVEKDGSLKADEAYEYVTPQPLDLKGVAKSMQALRDAYKENKSVHNDSVRAGVHVHMNVQNFDVAKVFTFVTLYYTVEELLLRWCGPDRHGNLFCLGSSHAEHQVFAIQEALATRNWKALKTDHLRYASLNLQSLFKYGSLEFRSMRSTPDLEKIEEWVHILDELRQSAAEFNSPVDVMYAFSGNGAEAFLQRIFPKNWRKLVYDGYAADIRDACHRTQPLAFTIDWGSFDRPMNNPFVNQAM